MAIIRELPLNQFDRALLVEIALDEFIAVCRRLGPDIAAKARERWHPDVFVDEILFSDLQLPMKREAVLDIIGPLVQLSVVECLIENEENVGTESGKR